MIELDLHVIELHACAHTFCVMAKGEYSYERNLLARAANGSLNTAIYTLWRDLAPTAMTGLSSAI